MKTLPISVNQVPDEPAQLPSAERPRLRKRGLELSLDFLAGAAWSLLALGFLWTAITQKSPLHAGLASFYGMIGYSMVARRPVRRAGAWWEWLLGMLTLAYPLAVTRGSSPVSFLWLAWILQAGGLVVMLAAMVSLRRSFGIAPADRGLITHGLYGYVRHPLYAGELIYNLGCLLLNLAWGNIAAYLILVAIQAARIMREERIIAGYALYATMVRWRLLPLLW